MKNSIKCLFAAMLVIFAASCQKEENQVKPGKGEPRTITATLANSDPQTKTHLDENLKTLWSEGDTIWISDGTNSAKIQLIKDESEPKKGYIKGTLAADEKSFTFTVPEEITGTVHAVYPAFAQDGIDGGIIKFKIPTVQSGTFGDANISVAKESSNILQFKNATAVIKFVQEKPVNKSVYLSASTQLAGRVKIGYGDPFTVTADNPEMTGVMANFVDDTVSYVAVAPGTASNLVVKVLTESFSSANKLVASKQFYMNKVYRTSVDGMVSYEDLKTYSGANCHIIPCGGPFKLDVSKKGNSQEDVGAIDTVEVLWESFGTATVPEKGAIIVVSPDTQVKDKPMVTTTGNEGNAVIAAKDASGNILWSWHIWVCSGYDPEKTAQTYNNSAGVMMDRNIGATSATPGEVSALGLLYQWGRKDPFLGGETILSNTIAKSTGTWESATSSTVSTGTFAYAVQHPMQFIKYNSNNCDWYYSNDASTDNTRWQTSDTSKGLYDPCPVGWRVPDGGANGIWATAGFQSGAFDDTNRGMDFASCTKSNICWYPAAGYRLLDDGSLTSVGSLGNYWSCSPDDSNAYSLYFGTNGYVYPSNYGCRANGQSVRCLSDSK